MSYTTYSFSQVNVVLATSGYPAYTVNGQGVGEIAIANANDNTSHDLAADGNVMVSKIKAQNGNLSITVQQTSALHGWLKGLYNYLTSPNTPASAWAAMGVSITGIDNITLTGVSFQKIADQPYQAQGQRVTWMFMYANRADMGTIQAAINGLGNAI